MRIIVLQLWNRRRRVEGREGDKDHLEKDCREGERQSRVEELEGGQGSSAKQRVLGKEHDGLICLLAQREMMMMMKF